MYSTIQNIINRNKNANSKELAEAIKKHINLIINEVSSDCEYTSTQYLSTQLLKKIQ